MKEKSNNKQDKSTKLNLPPLKAPNPLEESIINEKTANKNENEIYLEKTDTERLLLEMYHMLEIILNSLGFKKKENCE